MREISYQALIIPTKLVLDSDRGVGIRYFTGLLQPFSKLFFSELFHRYLAVYENHEISL